MRILMLALLGVLASAASAAEERSAEIEKLIAEAKASIEPRVIPGGKSLQDIFGKWFAKVDRTDENGLSVRLMRGGTHTVKIYTDEHSFKRIGAGNTVNISPGDRKIIWVELCSIEISLDRKSFPASDCSWLTNSAHTVYVKLQQSSEFNATDKNDEYFISMDLKKAYYLQGKREVDYPFPFVNPRPDISQEEWELQSALPGYLQDIDATTREYQKACNPIQPNVRRVLRRAKEGRDREKIEYIVFDEDLRSLSCVTYYPKDGDEAADVTFERFDHAKGLHKVARMTSDGSFVVCDLLSKEKYVKVKDEAFRRTFVRETLKRLNLTAKDLPDINLDAILGTE